MGTSRRLVALGAAAAAAALLTQVGSLTAADADAPSATSVGAATGSKVDPRLGNGLGRLVAGTGANKRGPAGGLDVKQSDLALRDDAGRVLVDLVTVKGADLAAFGKAASALGLRVTATDARTGTLEGYAPLAAMTKLAGLRDLGSINQVLKPVTHAGKTTSQGVAFQKVDEVLAKGVDGAGITVGVLSDSYDASDTDLGGGPEILTHADDDVASGDLPGPGNPEGDTQPVVVVEEYQGAASGATDEGRAMLQIVHDVAPKAKLCFASAFNGDVGFANNIRKLADRDGACKADVIVDDVSYFNEPFYSDGVISAAVDDVKAAGVSYFSSAGNAGDQNAWRSKVDLVAPDAVPAAADKAGLDFSEVPPSIYAGGLQDMDPGTGSDVAQDIALSAEGGLLDLQWNDPVDRDGAVVGDPVFEDTGELTKDNSARGVDFTFDVGADLVGKTAQFRTDAIPTGTTDLIIDVTTPSGDHLGPVDTGASPEVITAPLPEAGAYTITVSGFGGATGDFTVDVSEILSPSTTTTDFNVLLFDEDGQYLGSAGDDNTLTGQPNEVLSLPGPPFLPSRIQLVLAKTTAAQTPVTEIAYINNGGIFTDEYFDPTAPATFGHSTAAGANGIAAYDPFKPYVPEYYTSPGGALTFYFNRNGQRLRTPQVRMKPDVASTDRGNTTFFVADDLRDADTFPNFGGTSAAAPHAAAIAALMLDEAGGPGSLTPDEVAGTMKKSTFKHDLDPFKAGGTTGGLKVQAVGAPGDERDEVPASMDDPNFFRVSYTGTTAIRSITFNGRTASPTALGATPTAGSAGLVFDPRPLAEPGQYRTSGYPFTVGGVAGGLKATDIDPSYSDPAGGTGTYRTLKVQFAKNLKKGQDFRFGIDRDIRFPGLATTPVEGNGADEIGGGVFIPQDKVQAKGLTFVATLTNGKTITGQVSNKIGAGFSPVDGYGVVDASRAVFGN